jgi:Mg-chelatase subunit ChlD
VAILAFSNGVTVARDFQNQNSDISEALDKLTATDEGCPMGAGLTKAKNILQGQGRKGVLKVLITLSGGKSDDDVTAPAQELQKAGILVYTVGLGKAADLPTLGTVSSSPPSAFVIQEADFPFKTNSQNVLLTELKGSEYVNIKHQ